MLKAFLDRYGNNGLAGVTAVPVMTGGWPGHLLAVEVHLRPVLVELGATVPARGLYVTEPELADLPTAVGKWAAAALPLIAASVKGRLPGEMPVKGRVPAAPEKERFRARRHSSPRAGRGRRRSRGHRRAWSARQCTR